MQGRAESILKIWEWGKEMAPCRGRNKKVLQEAPFRVEYSMRLGV